jgi:hypothetical protein
MNLGHRVSAGASPPIRIAIVNQWATAPDTCERWVTKVTRFGI